MICKCFFYVGLVALLTTCSRRAEVNSEETSLLLADSPKYQTKIMKDGKRWLTENLSVKMTETYCQQNDEELCKQYGRLYTWEVALKACTSLGKGWRLPTNEEWQTLAKGYGGIYDDSNDKGKSAYVSLMQGGGSGFNAVLGGNREPDGNYQRLGAHGFYWTSSEQDGTNAWFYNFAKGSTLLNHHTGDKRRAVSVRCIYDSLIR